MSTNSVVGARLADRFDRRDERVRHGDDGVARPTPAAISANRTASVPLATPTQYFVPQYSANSRSKPSTCGPPMNAAERTASRNAARAPLRARDAG